MPLDTNGQYVAPSPAWTNDNEPAIDADELNAMSGAIAGAVEYDRAQTISSTDQAQARTNIGAASQADMTQAQADILALQQAVVALQAAASS
jgi:hypothetical protein